MNEVERQYQGTRQGYMGDPRQLANVANQAATRQPAVHEALEVLERELTQLEEGWRALGARLRCVREQRPEVASVPSKAGDRSPLVSGALRDVTDRLETVNRELREALDALEV